MVEHSGERIASFAIDATGPFGESVVAEIRSVLGDSLRSAVLFGSRARGNAREESDIDLLVVAERLPDRAMERSRLLQRAVADLPTTLPLSVLGYTPEEFEAGFPPLYLDLAVDGRILFDTGYIGPRLARIREIIREAGLRPRKSPDGEMGWEWERYPATAHWRLDWDGYRER